jgi:hypothetical protein
MHFFLLGLPETAGDHTGINFTEGVVVIAGKFNLENRLGYFVLNNAENSLHSCCYHRAAHRFGFDMAER